MCSINQLETRQGFFKNWTAPDGAKWKNAEGSSLSDDEKICLCNEGIVMHSKGEGQKKIFAMCGDQLKSVIIYVKCEAQLISDLKNLGYCCA